MQAIQTPHQLGTNPKDGADDVLENCVALNQLEHALSELVLWTEPATRLDAFKESLGARRWLRRRVKTSLSRLRKIFEERPEAPLARATIAGYEPAKAARFGSF